MKSLCILHITTKTTALKKLEMVISTFSELVSGKGYNLTMTISIDRYAGSACKRKYHYSSNSIWKVLYIMCHSATVSSVSFSIEGA
jgi:hypothetical protein